MKLIKRTLSNFKECPVWTIWLIVLIVTTVLYIDAYGLVETGLGGILIMNDVIFYVVIMWTGQTKRYNSELLKKLSEKD